MVCSSVCSAHLCFRGTMASIARLWDSAAQSDFCGARLLLLLLRMARRARVFASLCPTLASPRQSRSATRLPWHYCSSNYFFSRTVDPTDRGHAIGKSRRLQMMFATLLLALFPFSFLIYACNGDHYDLYSTLVLTVHILCIANVIFENRFVQVMLHDMFACLLAYGLLGSMRLSARICASFFTIVMLTTRLKYHRCLFLWWKRHRRVELDLVALVALFCGCARSRPILSPIDCVVAAAGFHALH